MLFYEPLLAGRAIGNELLPTLVLHFLQDGVNFLIVLGLVKQLILTCSMVI